MNDSYIFGLIGHNIAYSRSPEIFAAIFAADKVAGRFDLFDVAPGDLSAGVAEIVRAGVQGLSVTIPHKQQVCDLVDSLDEAAQAIGAVNSIAVRDGRLHGYNTDSFGFAAPLCSIAPGLAARSALVLGSGGGARAAAYTLASEFKVARILIAARSQESASGCAGALKSMLPATTINAATISSLPQGESYGIVVNATPLGGWNHPDSSPLPAGFQWRDTGIYYDLNYNDNNSLVSQAKAAGVRAVDGSAMLVAQALCSYTLWTGRTVGFNAVYQTVFPGRKQIET